MILRFQPPPVYPSGEHTHSLSLSDSEEDATLPSQKAKQAVSADQTNDPVSAVAIKQLSNSCRCRNILGGGGSLKGDNIIMGTENLPTP